MSAKLRIEWRGLLPGAHTSPTLATNRFHRPIDLCHRRRLDAGFRHTCGSHQKCVGRRLPPDPIGEELQ